MVFFLQLTNLNDRTHCGQSMREVAERDAKLHKKIDIRKCMSIFFAFVFGLSTFSLT